MPLSSQETISNPVTTLTLVCLVFGIGLEDKAPNLLISPTHQGTNSQEADAQVTGSL
jgi:hypothetical protein